MCFPSHVHDRYQIYLLLLPVTISYCTCLLLVPIAAACCYCLLLLPIAIAYCCCLLPLPLVIACCCCLLLLPIAIACCLRLLSLPIGDCPLLLPIGVACCSCFSNRFSNCASLLQRALTIISAPSPSAAIGRLCSCLPPTSLLQRAPPHQRSTRMSVLSSKGK